MQHPAAFAAPVVVAIACLAAACADRAGGPATDDIPFGIDAVTDLASIAELRPPGFRVEQVSSLVLYYASPEPSLVETDRIEIGDAESEAAHELVAEGRVERTLTSAFRGDDSDRPVTARGIEAARTRFRFAIDPDNAGVRLRRVADIAAGRQAGEVRVDGVAAGTWYTADVNRALRFAELEFDLPPELTRDRESLEIELDARSSPSPWTAYGYGVSSDLAAPDQR